jgi:hypothetical protein
MILAVLLLLTAPSQVRLIDDDVAVPAGEWHALPILFRQQTGTVDAAFRAIHGGPVRIALLTRQEALELRKGALHTEIAATPFGSGAKLTVPIRTAGDYELMVDNREGRTPAELHLTVTVTTDGSGGLQVRYASPRRKQAVIFASMGFFAAIAGFAGAKLRRAMKTR